MILFRDLYEYERMGRERRERVVWWKSGPLLLNVIFIPSGPIALFL